MKLFLDSSVLLAALWSETGGSAKILALCEAKMVEGYISNTVIEEVQRVLARKAPEILPIFKKLLKVTQLKIVHDVTPHRIEQAKKWIKDPNDAPILAAAKKERVDALITLDLKDFIRDPNVSLKSGLKIYTPGDFLNQIE